MATSLCLSFVMFAAVLIGTLHASSHGWFDAPEETYEYNGAVFSLHRDSLPVTLGDLFDTSFEEYTRERRMTRSFLLSRSQMRECPRFDAPDFPSLPSLDYTVLHIKAPFLYSVCREEMLHAQDGWNEYAPEENQ